MRSFSLSSRLLGLWCVLSCTGEITDAGADRGFPATGGVPAAGTGSATGDVGGRGGISSGGAGSGLGGGGSTPAPSEPGAGAPGDAGYCAVQALLASRCVSCHGSPPLAGVPMSLATHADLLAPARSNPAVSVAEISLARLENASAPMPPAPAMRATAAEIAAFRSWLDAGRPATCVPAPGAGGTGGVTGAAGSAGNPFDAPPVCTSDRRFTDDDDEGPQMRPGNACIACHTADEGPRFRVAGTVYPTAHEPNDCFGVNGQSAGVTVVIVDASGASQTLNVNAAGNFYSTSAIALPYRAKVVRNGVERVMATPQQSGDCNGCHTPAGTNGAPGRILLP